MLGVITTDNRQRRLVGTRTRLISFQERVWQHVYSPSLHVMVVSVLEHRKQTPPAESRHSATVDGAMSDPCPHEHYAIPVRSSQVKLRKMCVTSSSD